MTITLELFDDCTDFDGTLESALTHLCWQLKIDGKDFGELETYETICKKLDVLMDYEELLYTKQK